MTRPVHAPKIAKSTTAQSCDTLRYVCDTCGISYAEEHDARGCEVKHLLSAVVITEATDHDPVNRPAHYVVGGIETIDYIQSRLTSAEFQGFCLGNVYKYLSRKGRKGDADEDMRKALWYLDRAITALKP